MQQLHDIRREHVRTKEQRLSNAVAIACETSARVGLQEGMERFDEQFEVARFYEGEKSPTESGMVELSALFVVSLGPHSSQMCCLPLIKRCLPVVPSPSRTVGSYDISDL